MSTTRQVLFRSILILIVLSLATVFPSYRPLQAGNDARPRESANIVSWVLNSATPNPDCTNFSFSGTVNYNSGTGTTYELYYRIYLNGSPVGTGGPGGPAGPAGPSLTVGDTRVGSPNASCEVDFYLVEDPLAPGTIVATSPRYIIYTPPVPQPPSSPPAYEPWHFAPSAADPVTSALYGQFPFQDQIACGIFVNHWWGLKYIHATNFPACADHLPHGVVVACLTNTGVWTTATIPDQRVNPAGVYYALVKQHGHCAVFPK